jgi:hypothetical protein
VTGQAYGEVEAMLIKGFNRGDWRGSGITSSSGTGADTGGITTLGVADNAKLGYAQFAGLTDLTGHEVLVRSTYLGDADLNGSVELGDFHRFLSGFDGDAGASWSSGDFDYSGSVDLGDFRRFLIGLAGQPSPYLSPELYAELTQFGHDHDVAVDLSAIPEPSASALALIAAGVCGAAGRGRRAAREACVREGVSGEST